MRSRARDVGGTLTVQSPTGGGTSIVADLSLEEA
jgi:signal transduction histidine kinase